MHIRMTRTHICTLAIQIAQLLHIVQCVHHMTIRRKQADVRLHADCVPETFSPPNRRQNISSTVFSLRKGWSHKCTSFLLTCTERQQCAALCQDALKPSTSPQKEPKRTEDYFSACWFNCNSKFGLRADLLLFLTASGCLQKDDKELRGAGSITGLCVIMPGQITQ